MTVSLNLISLQDSIAQLAACKKVLSPDETERMLRFATTPLQERFALTRGHLRFTLAQDLNCKPCEIEFTYNEFGKPFLKNHTLQFNIAHSGDYCVIGTTSESLIGVDIEKCEDTHKPHIEIAERFFTPTEFKAIKSAQNPEALFFHIWTQKEAFLKAIGRGLSFGLDQFEVATDLSQSFVHNIQDAQYAKCKWSSQSFDNLAGYRLTVTKEGQLGEIKRVGF